MLRLSPPKEIRDMESFGVGYFTEEELEDKCAAVRKKMPQVSGNETPSISIVIPAFNEKISLVATMRSISEQTKRDIELIVVSNGEEYGNMTQRIAERCGAKVIHEPKGGIGLARQIGLQEARSSIVASTDADTLHDKKWAESIVYGMNLSQAAYGFGPVHSLSEKLSRRMFMESHNITRYLRTQIHFLRNAGLSEANSFYLRDAALDAGGYDIHRNFGEGMDLLRRISPTLDAKFFYDEDFAAYPSGRKMDQMSLFTLCTISIRLGLAHALGKDLALDEDEYPHIR